MKIIHLIPSLPHLLILHLALTSILCVTPNASKKCRALVLEGGGDKGSFQVGVLKALVDNLPPKEVKWDVVTGVSVGSINAVGVGLHEIGEEKKAIDWMVDMWGNLGKTDIYTNWNFGILQGLFYKEGLWNNEPEYEYLKSTFDQFPDKKLKRRVNINTCEINTGEYFRFEESTEWEKLPAAVRASSAVPLVFPHTYLNNHTFIDGGSIWDLDLGGAIERCKEVVKDDKDIIVDVVLCTTKPDEIDPSPENNTVMYNYNRYQAIRKFYGSLSDYCEIKRGYPEVNFRYVVGPEGSLPTSNFPLQFDHDKILEMIDMGILEGEKSINDHQDWLNENVETYKNEIFCPDQ